MALLLAAPRHVSARNAIDLSVYVVTDSGINARRGRSIEEAVAAAVAGGATVVQLREKSLSSADFYSMAKRVKAITTKARVPLIINDRIDIALAVSAEGVHLGQGDIPAAVARRMVGPNMILGVSAKTPKQALQAETDGADYIGVGAVYGTSTKSDAEDIGLEGLARVRAVVDLPIVAIGGITLGDSARAVISVGAQGAAVVSAVFDTEDVEVATRTLAVSIAAAKAMSNGRR
jgi:thiamine-phosphate pyrophosphorylase